MLENMFDCLCNDTLKPKGIFDECISKNEFEKDKILFANERTDLLEDCFESYSEMVGNSKRRKFPLPKFLRLYSFVLYFLDNAAEKTIEKEDFKKRLRIINNLIRNSEDEISDSTSRSGGNRMPAIIEQVESIVKSGKIDENIAVNFNKNQIDEEIKKLEWININEDKYYDLCKIETHNMLYGSIAVVGIDNINYNFVNAFENLFNVADKRKIDSALLCMGEYSQYRKSENYREFGGKYDSSWKNLFHKSDQRKNFENTKNSLIDLLTKISTSNKTVLEVLDETIKEFIDKCESDNLYDWRYYYVKYRDSFSYEYGMNCWEDFREKPYVMITMTTSSNLSINCYDPYLDAVDAEHRAKAWWSSGKCGTRLVYNNIHIVSTNDGFDVLDHDDNDNVLNHISVKQNVENIDMENRIELLKQYIEINALHKKI